MFFGVVCICRVVGFVVVAIAHGAVMAGVVGVWSVLGNVCGVAVNFGVVGVCVLCCLRCVGVLVFVVLVG